MAEVARILNYEGFAIIGATGGAVCMCVCMGGERTGREEKQYIALHRASVYC